MLSQVGIHIFLPTIPSSVTPRPSHREAGRQDEQDLKGPGEAFVAIGILE
jgi:hypothetical protein